jgi:N-acetylmuramic acid 6-phosphate etherase
MEWEMTADEFLAIASAYRLGNLPTEQPHPETVGLAEWAQADLGRAVAAFHRVDRLALARLEGLLTPLPRLVEAIRETLGAGRRVFLSGCGATGRLALALESLVREEWMPTDPDRVIGFMAGGDAALIRSIESFEDFPAYGERQLQELGFVAGDLLIAITEGGETPFVIGTVLEAARHKGPDPWFVFCNPTDLLIHTIARSREVLRHPRIQAFALPVGPMALSGSTRLQATTVQMLAVGAALSEATGNVPAMELVDRFIQRLQALAPSELIPFIEAEADTYQRGHQVLYEADRFAITVLTDTTERAPTFSQPPFESRDHPDEPSSPCYMSIPDTASSAEAWASLLKRPPRALSWDGITHKATLAYLLGHDISMEALAWRQARCPTSRQYRYQIKGPEPRLCFRGHELALGPDDDPLLVRHLVLKISLNLQSTLVMGRLGRFESNLMTWVKPANNKLIDRAARYRQNRHLQQTGEALPYEAAVRAVFAALEAGEQGP